jgi:DNA repair exonuclease SbcCD ATPase subunit
MYRFKSVTMSGFGGVSDTVTVNLDADVVVITGDNGIGKTTVCNALVWAISGIHPSGANPRNLYSKSGSTYVSLVLSQGNSEVEINRTLANPSADSEKDFIWNVSVFVDGFPIDSRRGEEWIASNLLANRQDNPYDDSIAGAIESVYMKQDSLKEFLADRDDVQRFSSVARMVGASRLAELVARFESEKSSWVRALNRDDEELVPRRDFVQELQVGLAELNDQVASLNTPEVSERWTNWAQKADLLLGSTNLANQQMSRTLIRETLDGLTALVQADQRRRDQLLSLSEEYATPLPSGPSAAEIESATAQLAAADRDLLDLQERQRLAGESLEVLEQELARRTSQADDIAALAQIALRHVSNECPACGQTVEPIDFATRLGMLILSANQPQEVDGINLAREAHSHAIEALRQARVRRAELQEALSGLGAQRNQIESAERRRIERAIDLDLLSNVVLTGVTLSLPAIITALERELTSSSSRIGDAQGLIETGDNLSTVAALLDAESQRSTLVQELEFASRALTRDENEIRLRREASKRGDRLLRALKNDAESFVSNRISQLQPLLDQVYGTIDPHPTLRRIEIRTRLFGGKQRLDPVVHDDDAGVSMLKPGIMLSTSQANALAVCLFLSFNLGFATHSLASMVLDDPLQNLDDVHLLGMVDLLRKVSPYRQLILTTHDEAFAALFARKLRPVEAGRRTLLVRLESWSRSGPAVSDIEVPVEGLDLKLAASA